MPVKLKTRRMGSGPEKPQEAPAAQTMTLCRMLRAATWTVPQASFASNRFCGVIIVSKSLKVFPLCSHSHSRLAMAASTTGNSSASMSGIV